MTIFNYFEYVASDVTTSSYGTSMFKVLETIWAYIFVAPPHIKY